MDKSGTGGRGMKEELMWMSVFAVFSADCSMFLQSVFAGFFADNVELQ